jgi:hypothetical protein
VIDSWKSDRRRDSAARWLKAVADDTLLFDERAVVSYWQASKDDRAAKLISYNASPDLVARLLPALVDMCSEGWIVGRAAIRAAEINPATLQAIRTKFPATYAYVCAMTGRALTDEDAMGLILGLGPGYDDHRGLAIWAIGQLGMWQTLERIRECAPKIARQDLTAVVNRVSQPDIRPSSKAVF